MAPIFGVVSFPGQLVLRSYMLLFSMERRAEVQFCPRVFVCARACSYVLIPGEDVDALLFPGASCISPVQHLSQHTCISIRLPLSLSQ